MDLKQRIEAYNDFLKDHFSGNDLEASAKRAALFCVNREDLSSEVENQPSISNYIGNMLAKATARRDTAKVELKAVRGKAFIDISNNPVMGTGKKPRVEDTKSLVETNPMVLASEAELISAEKILNQIRADDVASMQKYRMLELLGGLVKQELYLKGYTK